MIHFQLLSRLLKGNRMLTTAVLFGIAPLAMLGQDSITQYRADSSHALNSTSQIPAFEVVSIKVNRSGTEAFRVNFTQDGINISNAPVIMLLRLAYGLLDAKDERFLGAPNWIKDERYDIEAKVNGTDVPAWHKLNREQLDSTLQTLLADRFRLAAHLEVKQLPSYALVVTKNGPKIKEPQVADESPNGSDNSPPHGSAGDIVFEPGRIAAQSIDIESLAHILSQVVGRTVFDKTGLTGPYTIDLKWTPDDQTVIPSGTDGSEGALDGQASSPSIFTALKEELGLKLDSITGPVKCMVIDHVERPSAN